MLLLWRSTLSLGSNMSEPAAAKLKIRRLLCNATSTQQQQHSDRVLASRKVSRSATFNVPTLQIQPVYATEYTRVALNTPSDTVR